MLITHRYESCKTPDRLFVEEKFTIYIVDVYKTTYSDGGLSIKTKGMDVVRQNSYCPAERKHKKICPRPSEP
jgi:hypothetical protein